MGRHLWSIQLYFSDGSYSLIPTPLHELVRFIRVRRETEGNIIRKTKPVGMWLLDYAIHKAQAFDGDKCVCKIIVDAGGD